MSKPKTTFVCQECQHEEAKWFGRCPGCGQWGSLEALELPNTSSSKRTSLGRGSGQPQPLDTIEADKTKRSSTHIKEFDRVLGGGLVPGMVALLGGSPGIGKSTLLLQAASAVAQHAGPVLYVSAEESLPQLKLRADRLAVNSPSLMVLSESDTEIIVEQVRSNPPKLLLIDSIQAVHSPELRSVPGSVAQVRECAQRFVELAKALSIPTILVGHVTKDGALAGPRTLEHVVDTVLHFEGERHHEHRVLRSLKNRFGASDILGVFKMDADGLTQVSNPSEAFLAEKPKSTPGSVVLATIEGTRPFLVEVQALVGSSTPGSPRRTAIGFDSNRLALILAILHRSLQLDLSERDVFLNVTGGLQIQEPGADLAAAIAIASAAWMQPVSDDAVFMGELGLTGELRNVHQMDKRIEEAARLGFRSVFAPPAQGSMKAHGLQLEHVASLKAAAQLSLETRVQTE